MTKKDFIKVDDAARKTVAKKYGWRQSSYLNWKVEKNYYFSFLHLQTKDASLEVKPLYFDDLWWEISGMFENEKKPPMSLRGNGCAAINSQEIARYDVIVNNPDCYTVDRIEDIWNDVFEKVSSDVHQFLKDYPDANTFFPDESRVRAFNKDRLDYMMALLHNNRSDEVISIIAEKKVRIISALIEVPKEIVTIISLNGVKEIRKTLLFLTAPSYMRRSRRFLFFNGI